MLQPTNCGSASTFTISAATHNGTYGRIAQRVSGAHRSGYVRLFAISQAPETGLGACLDRFSGLLASYTSQRVDAGLELAEYLVDAPQSVAIYDAVGDLTDLL